MVMNASDGDEFTPWIARLLLSALCQLHVREVYTAPDPHMAKTKCSQAFRFFFDSFLIIHYVTVRILEVYV